MKYLRLHHGVCAFGALVVMLVLSGCNSQENDAKVSSLTDQVNSLTGQVQALNSQVQTLTSQNTALKSELAECSKPEVPLTISTRPAIGGNGYILHAFNRGGATGDFSLSVTRPSTGRNNSWHFILNSGAVQELGEGDGWGFISGDIVTVQQAGCKDESVTVS